jgi:hypothetical protein
VAPVRPCEPVSPVRICCSFTVELAGKFMPPSLFLLIITPPIIIELPEINNSANGLAVFPKDTPVFPGIISRLVII